ncbi:hypothetical protein CRENBAI_017488 [Crenichthys baileyi]|uniref:Uncharacterized protein n=1 Tax=Crenichthys baileyi TaxID=28760 RepID=A0AAV9QVN4_9TELE
MEDHPQSGSPGQILPRGVRMIVRKPREAKGTGQLDLIERWCTITSFTLKLERPNQSPELSPTENLCKELKCFCKEELAKIPAEMYGKLVAHYKNHLPASVSNTGFSI